MHFRQIAPALLQGTERTDTALNIFLEYVPGGSIAGLLAKFGEQAQHIWVPCSQPQAGLMLEVKNISTPTMSQPLLLQTPPCCALAATLLA